MKLISVQSKNARLVRIICDDDNTNYETIEKEFYHTEKHGLKLLSEAVFCGTLEFALRRAKSFLKGAKA
jgi:hypothetical protein